MNKRKKLGMKSSKGHFEIIDKDDSRVPQSIREQLGKQEESKEALIRGREKEFVNIQKDYHESIFNINVILTELEVMIEQKGLDIKNREMKWNGMIIPDKVLSSRIALKNISYKEGISHLKYLEKALKNYGLTLEQIEKIGEDGKYIKEIPKQINEKSV